MDTKTHKSAREYYEEVLTKIKSGVVIDALDSLLEFYRRSPRDNIHQGYIILLIRSSVPLLNINPISHSCLGISDIYCNIIRNYYINSNLLDCIINSIENTAVKNLLRSFSYGMTELIRTDAFTTHVQKMCELLENTDDMGSASPNDINIPPSTRNLLSLGKQTYQKAFDSYCKYIIKVCPQLKQYKSVCGTRNSGIGFVIMENPMNTIFVPVIRLIIDLIANKHRCIVFTTDNNMKLMQILGNGIIQTRELKAFDLNGNREVMKQELLRTIAFCNFNENSDCLQLSFSRIAPQQIALACDVSISQHQEIDYHLNGYTEVNGDIVQLSYTLPSIPPKESYPSKNVLKTKCSRIVFCTHSSRFITRRVIDILFEVWMLLDHDIVFIVPSSHLYQTIRYKYDSKFMQALLIIACESPSIYHGCIAMSDSILDISSGYSYQIVLDSLPHNKPIVSINLDGESGLGWELMRDMGISDTCITVNNVAESVVEQLTTRCININSQLMSIGKSLIQLDANDYLKPWVTHFIDETGIQVGDVMTLSPFELLSCMRFDIIFKYIYAKYRSDWALKYYCEHIRVFNGGVEEVVGFQDFGKNSVNEFVQYFNKLVVSIDNGYDTNQIIPVAVINKTKLFPLNGSHRIGICLTADIPIKIKVEKELPQTVSGFTANGFIDRTLECMPRPGKDVLRSLSLPVLTYGMMEYVCLRLKYCPGCIRIMTLYGKSRIDKIANITDMLKELNVHVLFTLMVALSGNSRMNLMDEIYLDETFVNIETKTNLCFAEGNDVAFLVLESSDPKFLLGLSASGGKHKQQIRDMLGSRHSIHVTDNEIDTQRITKCVYHQNSMHNLSKMVRISDHIKTLLCNYKKQLHTVKNPDNYCIVSSVVMGIHGLREPNDLDYIHCESELNNPSHNKYAEYYELSLSEIIYDPQNYVYVHGVKICTPEIVMRMKMNRMEMPKDENDIELLRRIVKNDLHVPKKNLFNQTDVNLYTSILRRALLGEIKIETYPFPHLYIPNALPDELYEQLEIEYPRIEYFDGPPKMRSNAPIWKNCNMLMHDKRVSPVWKKFIGHHISYSFFDQFVSIFKESIETNYPGLINKITETNIEVRDNRNMGSKHTEKDFIMDFQTRVNTPVFKQSTVIGPHCDNPFKLYIGLIYFPVDGDDAGGDLYLYKMKDSQMKTKDVENGRFVDYKYLDCVKTIKYSRNNVVIFLGTENSIHGVQSRNQTLAYRRLCTLSTSYKNQLFDMSNEKHD